jgi:hypothetical protein
VLPLAALLGLTTLFAAGARSPTRLDPDLSWASPSARFPLGCG